MAGKYVMIRERVHRKGGNTMDNHDSKDFKNYTPATAPVVRSRQRSWGMFAVVTFEIHKILSYPVDYHKKSSQPELSWIIVRHMYCFGYPYSGRPLSFNLIYYI